MEVKTEAGVFILWAVMLLVLPLNWLVAMVLAAGWHESCHALVVFAFGGRIHEIRLHPTGVFMETSPLSPAASLFSALAGPAGSFLLLFLSPLFPRLALCGLAQGIFNLLPCYPLDGGRVLQSLCLLISPEKAELVCFYTKLFSAMLLIILSTVCCFWWKLGIGPLIFTGFLLVRIFPGKNSLHCGQTGGTIVLP